MCSWSGSNIINLCLCSKPHNFILYYHIHWISHTFIPPTSEQHCLESGSSISLFTCGTSFPVLGNKLDGPMLSTILLCLEKYFSPELVLEYMENLILVPRFTTVSLFLPSSETKGISWSIYTERALLFLWWLFQIRLRMFTKLKWHRVISSEMTVMLLANQIVRIPIAFNWLSSSWHGVV